jgi:hypothetical protein
MLVETGTSVCSGLAGGDDSQASGGRPDELRLDPIPLSSILGSSPSSHPFPVVRLALFRRLLAPFLPERELLAVTKEHGALAGEFRRAAESPDLGNEAGRRTCTQSHRARVGFITLARLERLFRGVPVDILDDPPRQLLFVPLVLEHVLEVGNTYGKVVPCR